MLKGKAWKYGDDVDTDAIIPARHLTSADPDVLKNHCLEDLDPGFAQKVSPGDIIVAGSNFGCGSSREHAPISIKAAGISAVIARSFGRIFFRNSINIGLPIVESGEAVDGIETGDEVELDLSTGLIRNLTRQTEYRSAAMPGFMQEIIDDGGLISHLKKVVASGEVAPAPAPPENSEEEPVERPKEIGARMKELEAEKADEGKAAPWVEEEEAPPAARVEDEDEEEEEEGE